MSLAIYAAPFDDNSNNDDNYISKKKQTHNKTQKRYPKEGFDTDKVNSVLEKIHKTQKEEDENDNLGDFNPPPKPQSAGVQKTIATEQMQTMLSHNNKNMYVLGKAPQPNYDNTDNLDLNNYNNNYIDDNAEYYKQHLANYNSNAIGPQNRQYYKTTLNQMATNVGQDNDVLLQKINYMINLLEEQQDERTNNVTEEVILYSFLGIFIIFIADSFAKVGKYIR
jgi:hypothetical protein